MHLDVAVVPGEAKNWNDKVVIMVDVIRASSTIVTLFERGCHHVYSVADSHQALSMARRFGLFSIGERDGAVISGFDCNNSPLQLTFTDVRGKDVVLSTTNGTTVLEQVVTGRNNLVLIGSAANAAACAGSALAAAEERNLGIVCAGRFGRLALDDAVCAGLLVKRIVGATAGKGILLNQSDGAKAALGLYCAYRSLTAAFTSSESGNILKRLGQENDVDLCARIDTSKIVPIVESCPEVAGLRIRKFG